MSRLALHDDLLQQARFLANREPVHPRQASLRRAVSAAYYTALTVEAAAILAPPDPPNLRAQIGRTFAHADMKKVCAGFKGGNPTGPNAATAALIVPPISRDIIAVAQTFVELQEAKPASGDSERHQRKHNGVFSGPTLRLNACQADNRPALLPRHDGAAGVFTRLPYPPPVRRKPGRCKSALSPAPLPPIPASSKNQKEHEDDKNEVHHVLHKIR